MKGYIGVTSREWFKNLSEMELLTLVFFYLVIGLRSPHVLEEINE